MYLEFVPHSGEFSFQLLLVCVLLSIIIGFPDSLYYYALLTTNSRFLTQLLQNIMIC